MEIFNFGTWLIVLVFCMGYIAIILEHFIHVNKTAIALLIAVLCWSIYLVTSGLPHKSRNSSSRASRLRSVANYLLFDGGNDAC